jgi:hypothetical protein
VHVLHLFVADEGGIEPHRGAKNGTSYQGFTANQIFEEHSIHANRSTALCMTTDGLADQIGTVSHCSFGNKCFQELLANTQNESKDKQEKIIRRLPVTYQGNPPRFDDISVFRVEIR